MNSSLETGLAAVDPDVPFRAVQSHLHRTWARTFSSRPELYVKPRTIAEVQKIVKVARRCRRRITTVGCGHSPSDLTCTSSWIVNLDDLNQVLDVDKKTGLMTVEAGIRLSTLNQIANNNGLTIPNLGSINEQSLAGAISTGTHGSTLLHGAISEKIHSFKIVLSDGLVKHCSPEDNIDLFRAGLLSLGALGIIVEITYAMCPATNIEWTQTLVSLSSVLNSWSTSLWTQHEFTRIWWLPYLERAVVWSADKTSLAPRPSKANFYGGSVGFHTYHILLRISNLIPSILPWIEWFVFGIQYSFHTGESTSAVEPMQHGLLMNCLYSQFVNEWAVPLSKGPEIIRRLGAWINHRPFSEHQIPFSSKGLWVHAPIEVRVSDTTKASPRAFLDWTPSAEPTLYLNATLYRPYLVDPPCKDRYYEAFEWLMREYKGRPHWAKNFSATSGAYIREQYGEDLREWRRIRDEVDPDGVFVGDWHRRTLLGEEGPRYRCEEVNVEETPASDGGKNWVGKINGTGHEVLVLAGKGTGPNEDEEDDDSIKPRYKDDASAKSSITGTEVFAKM